LILEIEPGSPAEHASLLPGDLITGIESAQTSDMEALEAALTKAAADKRASVVVRFLRGESRRERQATAASSMFAEQTV
jgi:S1-C subfamily serine protease